MLKNKSIEGTGYINKAEEIARLVTNKQKQYGNAISSTGEFLKSLYPNGITPEQYEDLGILVRMYDKMKRIANGNQGEENAWNDLMGYALLKAAAPRG